MNNTTGANQGVSQNIAPVSTKFLSRKKKKGYLPGRGDTVIAKVVFPEQGFPVALWMC